MKRREFFASSLGIVAASALPQAGHQFPNVPGLTKYVSEFIVNTKYKDVPADMTQEPPYLEEFPVPLTRVQVFLPLSGLPSFSVNVAS